MAPCNTTEIVPFKLQPLLKRSGVHRFSRERGWKDITKGPCNFPIPKKVKKWKPLKYLSRVFSEPKKVCNAAVQAAIGQHVDTGLELVIGDDGATIPKEALQPSIEEIKAVVDGKTGCNCVSAKNWECVCCAWAFEWFFCQAVGLMKTSLTIYFVTTVEDTIVLTFEQYLLDLISLLEWCVPLPPPVNLISVCIGLRLEEVQGYRIYKFCADFSLGFIWFLTVKLFSLCQQFDFGKKFQPERIGQEDYNVTVSMVRQSHSDNVTIGGGRVFEDSMTRALVIYGSSRKIRTIKAMHHADYEVPWVLDAVKVRERVNWRSTAPGETPYLAVIYAHKKQPLRSLDKKILHELPTFAGAVRKAESQRWMENSHHHVFYSGGSCGAAIMTPNKVLTNCGCIRTFYLRNKLKKKMKEVRQEGFDIQSDEIFLQIAEPKFNVDSETYQLDKNPDNFMKESSCVDGIIANLSQAYLETMMMVMSFTPDIADHAERHFMEWPPIKIDQIAQEASLTSLGMEPNDPYWNFVDSTSRTLNLESTPVDYFMKKCESHFCSDMFSGALSKVKEPESASLKGRTICFCSRDLGAQVWRGDIGFPILSEGRLVGLSATSVDGEAEGGLIGTFFDETTIRQIGKYVGSATSINLLGIGDYFIIQCIQVFLPFLMLSLL